MASALCEKRLAVANNNMTVNRSGGDRTEDTGVRRHVSRGTRVEEPVTAAATIGVDGHAVQGGVEPGRQLALSGGVEGGILRRR